jgi:hypothetical protein
MKGVNTEHLQKILHHLQMTRTSGPKQSGAAKMITRISTPTLFHHFADRFQVAILRRDEPPVQWSFVL